MTKRLFLDDSYRTRCEAQITAMHQVGNKLSLVLDQTIFQPNNRDGGDRGHLFRLDNHTEIEIPTVVLDSGSNQIEHRTRPQALAVGVFVECHLDWQQREAILRRHTANHILYGCGKRLLNRGFPALSKSTPHQMYSRWIGVADQVDQSLITEVYAMANQITTLGRPVLIETLPRDAALERCGRYHETVLPRSAAELRVVTIEDLDSDPCIGLHVRNTREVGRIETLQLERVGTDVLLHSTLAG